jgi:hypothetical protein
LPARILARHVPAWFQQRPTLRTAFVRDVQRFLGGSVAASVRPFVENAPLDRLVEVWHRIPYIEKLENLFDPEWSLGVDLLTTGNLIYHTFTKPIRWGILLELRYRKSGISFRASLLTDAPWLALLKDSESALDALIKNGVLAFRCPSEQRAAQLQSQVATRSLRCTVLGSGGHEEVFREGGHTSA